MVSVPRSYAQSGVPQETMYRVDSLYAVVLNYLYIVDDDRLKVSQSDSIVDTITFIGASIDLALSEEPRDCIASADVNRLSYRLKRNLCSLKKLVTDDTTLYRIEAGIPIRKTTLDEAIGTLEATINTFRDSTAPRPRAHKETEALNGSFS